MRPDESNAFDAVTELKLTPYDPLWVTRFEEETRAIERAVRDTVAVEHVGSTSVLGLAAKPTVDIAVEVKSLALSPDACQRIEAEGYVRGDDIDLPQLVFRKGSLPPWEVLVHVVEYGGSLWRDMLYFRDYLRANPDEAARYEELKASLLAGRRSWYDSASKRDFIRRILNARR